MVFPKMGEGATHRKFDIFRFKMSISPPLGPCYESNSHPWGELIGTHNNQHSASPWGNNLVTNDTHKLCALLARYLTWLAI